MKTSFLPRLVNGQTGDPALYIDLLREKRALLFDCGSITSLSPSEILRVSDVFVSHAHIDHFIGFDHLLRLHLGRGHRVRIHGPPGITACVHGKLRGYTWNLVRHQRLVFEVHEWDGRSKRKTRFVCRRRFKPEHGPVRPAGEVVWQDELIQVRAAALDHRIPSLAFAVSEGTFYNVDPEALGTCGLRPGPWLNLLKAWVRRGRPAGETLLVEGSEHDPAALADRLLLVTPGRTICYVADALGSPDNLAAIARLARGADLLFCEAAFLHQDRARARTTYHLTARQAGTAARMAGAGELVVFHFSPKYEGRFAELEREAEEARRDASGSAGDAAVTPPG